MKLILLFMTIPLIISLFKNIFVFNNEKTISGLKDKIEDVAEKNKLEVKVVEGLACLICFMLWVYYGLFFTMSAIFVNNIFFAITSFVILLRTWKVLLKIMTFEDLKSAGFLNSSFWKIVNLMYFGILSYFLYIKW